MAFHQIHCEQVISAPVAEVFDFFARAENLAEITPPWLSFRILTPLPIEMKEGARIDYSIRSHGLPFRWQTRIERWAPPLAFVDVQVKGPYRVWRHTHSFTATDYGTLMTDSVQIALPFGLLGRLVYRLWVRRDVERIFTYRAEKIRERFREPARKARSTVAVPTGEAAARPRAGASR
jgi:hypothetical protein